MKNDVAQDALRLAENILKSLLPDEKWAIVNIAIDNKDVFSLEEYPSIPLSFGYKYDKSPTLLKQNKVIEGETTGWWYIGIKNSNSYWGRVRPGELLLDDKIAEVAQEKKYISEDEIAEYYYHVPTEDIGPRMHGQAAVLVNRQKLEEFIGWHSGLTPKFDEGKGIFEFLGETLQIGGKIENKSLKLLLDNINSIVSKKEFYEVRGKKDYDIIYRQTGVTKVNDSLEKVFLKLRKKFEFNPKFRSVIKFIQKDGFGIFINEKALLNPSKSQNSPRLP